MEEVGHVRLLRDTLRAAVRRARVDHVRMLRWPYVAPVFEGEGRRALARRVQRECPGGAARGSICGATRIRRCIEPGGAQAGGRTAHSGTALAPSRCIGGRVGVIVGVMEVQHISALWARLYIHQAGKNHYRAQLVADGAAECIREEASIGVASQVDIRAVHLRHRDQLVNHLQVGCPM